MPGRGRNSVPAPASAVNSAKPCFNCRRRRLRCDRSRPSCHKCWASGQDCLGYGTVLRWANAPAVRGKLVGQLAAGPKALSSSPNSSKAIEEPEPRMRPRSAPAAARLGDCNRPCLFVNPSLLDPLVNNPNQNERHYLHHFATVVCRDLISIDHNQNPFRTLIPLAASFDFLEAIIIATGAMHLASLHQLRLGDPGFGDGRREMLDALVAKDRAIRLLRSAVDNVTPANQAMVLSATVFFINLDLIDSGKGGWQAHIEAASTLMSTLHGPSRMLMDRSLMSLVDAIAADWLTYQILASAISGVPFPSWDKHDLANLFSILKRAEPYSYHCCPPEILLITLSASRLCSPDAADTASDRNRIEIARSLFRQARSVDVKQWVRNIRGLPPQDDLDARVSVAAAHRATACLYIVLAVPEVAVEGYDNYDPASAQPPLLDQLVREILGHLAAISIDHVHLKATIWPTFVAGAQTDDPLQREWCVERMQGLWKRNPWICPWGYVRTAIQMLRGLWDARDRERERKRESGLIGGGEGGSRNWLLELRSVRDKCLIV
ncbi:hypothetical protein VTK26DRAFT_6537 [Humicola hyalothermophila]